MRFVPPSAVLVAFFMAIGGCRRGEPHASPEATERAIASSLASAGAPSRQAAEREAFTSLARRRLDEVDRESVALRTRSQSATPTLKTTSEPMLQQLEILRRESTRVFDRLDTVNDVDWADAKHAAERDLRRMEQTVEKLRETLVASP